MPEERTFIGYQTLKDRIMKQGKYCTDKIYDVAVIGAGAAGMAAAVAAAEAGASVMLADGNEKAGRKLYATGNGRCNFTNINAEGADETIRFFERLGVLCRVEDEGRCYPYSGQAAAIVAALEGALRRAGADMYLADRVDSIKSPKDTEKAYDTFEIACDSGARYAARTVIIATGGRAGLKYGSTGDGYGFAKAFGHTLEPPRPALVPAESDDPFIPALKGVRAKADVTLEADGVVTAAESGEIQFTGSGISGICTFNLTRYMKTQRPAGNKKKKSGADSNTGSNNFKKYVISADLAPDYEADYLEDFIGRAARQSSQRAGDMSRADLAAALAGIVNSKLAGVTADRAWLPGAPDKSIRNAAGLLKSFTVNISCTRGWDDAQVTAGGVRLEETAAESMESRLMKGLYLCGEVLDFDGRCGGYNLQWAWQSGIRAGRAAAEAAVTGRTVDI